ncbi:hypothetical protein JOC86_004448 [Bacillus pakistanensis]|uniref:DUF1284 domain-containing protein n=1 Tax=Rossellomorea pakistanensis TaxID=992288 RepID=A0ABS2NJ83_9BACI|nr:DUF1284 domain-containing protein [Bacillus pakistanensis]MBM7587873.1 hypothetical protein [Bacillus pakistanensis]
MKRAIRGHHLLCIHGFKGMGYSPAFVDEMGAIVKDFNSNREDIEIEVRASFDDACFACPHKGETKCEKSEDSNQHVLSLDHRVINHLGISPGESYNKNELLSHTAEKVSPEDLDHLCEGCSWLSFGVCKEGIQDLKEKFNNTVGDIHFSSFIYMKI